MVRPPIGPWDVANTIAANLPAICAALAGLAGAWFSYRGTLQNAVLHRQGQDVLKATNGIQEAAIALNRRDAAAEAVIGERERVADQSSEQRHEESRGQS